MKSKTHRFTYCSNSCYEIFGFTSSEMLELTLQDMFPQEYINVISAVTKEKLAKFKKTGLEPEAKYEVQQYHKDGHLI
jgi:PAS domain S-box-containing protein